jgi:Mor family transcriptional regulator
VLGLRLAQHLPAEQAAALARAFDGHNHADLARRYGLTVTQVYDILQRQHQTRQTPLF